MSVTLKTSEASSGSFELWVSPDGDDEGTGRAEAPFRSLRRAHDALRDIADRASSAASITIYLFDGVYRLDAPLVFDSQLFGSNGPQVSIVAAPGASPVISGAIPVKCWTLHDKDLNIYKAGIGKPKIGAYRSRQLYVNGRRATRARTKLSDGMPLAGFLPSPVLPPDTDDGGPYIITGGIRFQPTPLNPERWRDPPRWKNLRDIEAVIKTQWKMMSVPLDYIAPASEPPNGMLVLQQPGWSNANMFFGMPSKNAPSVPSIWSMWQVTYFENAYEFLDQPGEWYLDNAAGEIYYIPRDGEDMTTADVELPILETLVEAMGTADAPVANLRFEGIAFQYATWLAPSSGQGYVADQSGFYLIGDRHKPNIIGHAQYTARTPGNLRFKYAHNIVFKHNRFEHLGAVALDFDTGCQRNRVEGNRFDDISSAAVQLGGVGPTDRSPSRSEEYTIDNVISHNSISATGRDFVDSAAIYVGFTRKTLIENNSIDDVPWAGIAIGWGWGLLDKGMFPGAPGATPGMWGDYDTPTPNSGNKIVRNRISRFLQDRWDGGAIYTNGQQGLSMDDALLIEGNVACGKRKQAGGNTFYTDAASRYIVFRNNASFDNPIGHIDLGPPPQATDPLPYPKLPSSANIVPYGSDIGGCRTYGDIHYENNYWMAGLIPVQELAIDVAEVLITCILSQGRTVMDTYSKQGYFNICPYAQEGVSYPTNLTFTDNHDILLGEIEVPPEILRNAGN